MEWYSVSEDQRKQFSLPPELDVYLLWRMGYGVPSPDGTFWSLPSDLATLLFDLHSKFGKSV